MIRRMSRSSTFLVSCGARELALPSVRSRRSKGKGSSPNHVRSQRTPLRHTSPADPSTLPRFMALTEAAKALNEKGGGETEACREASGHQPPASLHEDNGGVREADREGCGEAEARRETVGIQHTCLASWARPKPARKLLEEKQQQEKQPPRVTESPRKVKPVDANHLPRFMKTTVAYEKQIEKEAVLAVPVKSPKKVKPVDAKELPRYMQPTQTMLRRLEKPESVENAPARGRVSVKPVDGEALPNYMRATVAVEVAEKATKERKEAITEEMKKREEEEKELEEMKQKWEKKREEAERRHSGVY